MAGTILPGASPGWSRLRRYDQRGNRVEVKRAKSGTSLRAMAIVRRWNSRMEIGEDRRLHGLHGARRPVAVLYGSRACPGISNVLTPAPAVATHDKELAAGIAERPPCRSGHLG